MPPRRKAKSAKNKLAKMSEEERADYMKQQLIKEEQFKKQKEELLVQFMREKAGREQKSTQHNLIKIRSQWMKIMRTQKTEELQKELTALSQGFERKVDREESIIQSLLEDLDQSEEQQMMRIRRYAESIDELIAMQTERVLDLEMSFEKELSALETEFEEERRLVGELHTKHLSDEADIRFCIRTKFTNEEEAALAEFQMECDELKNKNLEDKHSLRIMLEQQLADMWDQFKQTTKDYQECTQDRRKQFDALKDRDQKLSKEIDEQGKKLEWLEKRIEVCKRQLKSTNHVSAERQKMLKDQKASLLSQFQDVKGYMTQFSQSEMRKLKRLCTSSEVCIHDLDDKLKLGEEILSLAEMCRRHEMEAEKVLPFYACVADTEPELAEAEAAERNADFPDDLRQIVDISENMTGFWKRFNKVKLEDLAMTRELEAEKVRNKYLTGKVSEYLNGLAVPKEVMETQNPLMVIRQHQPQERAKQHARTVTAPDNATPQRQRQPAPKVVVEAALAVKTLSLA